MATTLETIQQYMGYAYAPCKPLTDRLSEDGTLLLACSEIVDQLQVIDEQLTQARADSMAEKIDGLQVNYQGHVAHLRSEGIRLLSQLEALVDYPIHFNKYSGRYASHGQSSASITSYW